MQTSAARFTCIDDDDTVMFRCWTCHWFRYDIHSELLAARATAHFVWSNPRATQRSASHGAEVKSWN
jgi:hypothetical protein